jgi:hypothetical protein
MPFPFFSYFFAGWLVTILPSCQRHTNRRNGDSSLYFRCQKTSFSIVGSPFCFFWW